LVNATMSRRLWLVGCRENDFIEVTSAATVPFNALGRRKRGGAQLELSLKITTEMPAHALGQEEKAWRWGNTAG
jgi:hypothetical protein